MAEPCSVPARSPSGSGSAAPTVGWHQVPDRRRERFLLVRGETLGDDAPMVVAVHGISREPERYAETFGPPVAAAGGALIVPHFPSKRFRGYQRVRCNAGRRADRALLRMLDEAERLLHRPSSAVRLFGFSGGAQFAHRFAMIQPTRVRRLVLASAGTYTFPNPQLRYPLGLHRTGAHRRLVLDLDGYLRIPTLVLVGERDTDRDPALAQGQIDHLQGRDRVSRARRYTVALNLAARSRGLSPPARFALLPNANHGFDSCVAAGNLERLALDFLLGEIDARAGTAP